MVTTKTISPGIQSLRFIAASSVVIDHEMEAFVNRGLLSKASEQYGWHLGTFGVWTFFIISGFIMIKAERGAFGSSFDSYRFLIKRIIRIVPMYWIATFVSIIFFSFRLSHQTFWHDLAFSLSFIPYYQPASNAMHPILGQGWTLNYEMFFYMVFALCMIVSFWRGVALMAAVMTLIVFLGIYLRPFSEPQDPVTAATFLSSPIILLFVVGVLLGAVPDDVWRRLPALSFMSACLISVGIYSAACVVFGLCHFSYPMSFYGRAVFWPLAFAAVLVSALPRTADRFLDKILVLCGDASYCTYLFHLFSQRAINTLLIKAVHGKLAALLFLIFIVASANAFGILIHLGIERPTTDWLRRSFLSGRRTETVRQAV